jgi:hypothetical protein
MSASCELVGVYQDFLTATKRFHRSHQSFSIIDQKLLFLIQPVAIISPSQEYVTFRQSIGDFCNGGAFSLLNGAEGFLFSTAEGSYRGRLSVIDPLITTLDRLRDFMVRINGFHGWMQVMKSHACDFNT